MQSLNDDSNEVRGAMDVIPLKSKKLKSLIEMLCARRDNVPSLPLIRAVVYDLIKEEYFDNLMRNMQYSGHNDAYHFFTFSTQQPLQLTRFLEKCAEWGIVGWVTALGNNHYKLSILTGECAYDKVQ